MVEVLFDQDPINSDIVAVKRGIFHLDVLITLNLCGYCSFNCKAVLLDQVILKECGFLENFLCEIANNPC